MSNNDTTSRLCPACRNPMGARDTICGECRAKLVTHVMAVTAADYPEPEASSSQPTDDLGVPIAAAMDPQLADAVAQDPELLPLAPLDEPRVAALAAATAAPVPATSTQKPSVAPSRSPHVATQATRPSPPAPIPVIERPVVLNPPSRWKLIITVIVCIAICAVLAGILWSFMVPQPSETSTSPHTPTTTRAS